MRRLISKSRLRKLIITFVVTLVLLLAKNYDSAPRPHLAPLPGMYNVTHVYDGDTISVEMNGKDEKVRFIGVDTPETHDPRKSVQCFGVAASNFTTSLLSGKQVHLEADPLSTNRDRYDRLLRYVYSSDGRLVNQEIIAQGYGFAYTSFAFTKVDEFRAAERAAREADRGLWHECSLEIDAHGYQHTNDAP